MPRTIFHVDMDAFYASVEQRDHPEYRGKPVIVGADPRDGKGRGVVAACSYEARAFGVHSAQPISRAFLCCPRGIFLRPDFKNYAEVSRRIRGLFREFAERVEPLSIDEAFLDMTSRAADAEGALELARSLKQRVRRAEGLTASVGIGPSKFVAKIASDFRKPDGLVLVREEEVQDFLDPLPISSLWGVGPKTADRLRRMGIETILQLRHSDPRRLAREFGKLGRHVWKLSQGIDDRPVVVERETKSISQETTFSEDVAGREQLEQALARLSRGVAGRMQRASLTARTVTLKLRYSDFTTITRQRTLREPVEEADTIRDVSLHLLRRFRDRRRKVRLLGVSVSSLAPRENVRQMALFKGRDGNSESG